MVIMETVIPIIKKMYVQDVQLYTGMVFRGPNIVNMIKKELKELLIKDGVKNYTEIIGKKG